MAFGQGPRAGDRPLSRYRRRMANWGRRSGRPLSVVRVGPLARGSLLFAVVSLAIAVPVTMALLSFAVGVAAVPWLMGGFALVANRRMALIVTEGEVVVRNIWSTTRLDVGQVRFASFAKVGNVLRLILWTDDGRAVPATGVSARLLRGPDGSDEPAFADVDRSRQAVVAAGVAFRVGGAP